MNNGIIDREYVTFPKSLDNFQIKLIHVESYISTAKPKFDKKHSGRIEAKKKFSLPSSFLTQAKLSSNLLRIRSLSKKQSKIFSKPSSLLLPNSYPFKVNLSTNPLKQNKNLLTKKCATEGDINVIQDLQLKKEYSQQEKVSKNQKDKQYNQSILSRILNNERKERVCRSEHKYQKQYERMYKYETNKKQSNKLIPKVLRYHRRRQKEQNALLIKAVNQKVYKTYTLSRVILK